MINQIKLGIENLKNATYSKKWTHKRHITMEIKITLKQKFKIKIQHILAHFTMKKKKYFDLRYAPNASKLPLCAFVMANE